eukprot:518043-Pleurochrysis_carterae.AAC.1
MAALTLGNDRTRRTNGSASGRESSATKSAYVESCASSSTSLDRDASSTDSDSISTDFPATSAYATPC